MALFATAPAGSGVLSPIFPNLTLSYSYDGYGLVFSDLSHNFIYVFNGDCVDRAIQLTQFAQTPVIKSFGGAPYSTFIGPSSWLFKSYPGGLAYDFEIERYPTAGSEYPFPPSYVGGNQDLSRDRNYDTNNTGDGRRHVTWPPLRAMRYSTSGTLQASGWTASLGWNLTQLARPLAHIGARLNNGVGETVPFTPFGTVNEYTSGFQLNWLTGSNQQLIPQAWDCENKRRNCNDLDGVSRSWNAGDPAHNDVVPQFALGCMDHPLGLVLIWLLFSWYVQGMPPTTFNSFGMYSYPWGQERSAHWLFALHLYAYLLGIQWADPNLIRDWCGGLKPTHNNGGLGWRPRDALRWHLDNYVGPDYGGNASSVQSRFDYIGSQPTKEFGPHLPIMAAGTKFNYNGKNYNQLVAGLRGFHRYMTLWSIPEVIRAHDYVQQFDSTEYLIDPNRIASIRNFSRQHTQLTLDMGLIDF